ncbi:MAG TPA: hypothetical protein VH681_02550 [Nitrospiraceae bacterium]
MLIVMPMCNKYQRIVGWVQFLSVKHNGLMKERCLEVRVRRTIDEEACNAESKQTEDQGYGTWDPACGVAHGPF